MEDMDDEMIDEVPQVRSFISHATFSSKFSYRLENERKFHKLINSFYFFLINHVTEITEVEI